MTTDLAKELSLLDQVARKNRINELMKQMEFWGVHALASALDFFEGGVLTREEAIEVSGVNAKAFSAELLARKRERKRLMGRR